MRPKPSPCDVRGHEPVIARRTATAGGRPGCRTMAATPISATPVDESGNPAYVRPPALSIPG